STSGSLLNRLKLLIYLDPQSTHFAFPYHETTDIYTLSLHDALPISSLPLIKERILVIILLLHFLSLMLGSVLVLMLPSIKLRKCSKIGRAVQQECRDRSRMPSSA